LDLERQIDVTLEHFAQEIERKAARVEVQRPLPSVQGNPAVLGQVLMNLIANALKFVPPGKTPHVRIRAEEGSSVRLWIEDNGIGIKPEYHDRIFRVFERLHGGNLYPGTGIGLAIVAKGAERMGGRAGVESVFGEGSRFWIELSPAV
jgi:signal transduction histidine kinase